MNNEHTIIDDTLYFLNLSSAKEYGFNKIDSDWELHYNTLESGKVYYWYGHIGSGSWIEINEINCVE